MKMMKTILVLTMMMGISAQAEQVTVKVKGMVCSFCAQGIKKKLGEEGVGGIDVQLKDHLVKFDTDEKGMTDEKITALLKDSGYGVEKIERK